MDARRLLCLLVLLLPGGCHRLFPFASQAVDRPHAEAGRPPEQGLDAPALTDGLLPDCGVACPEDGLACTDDLSATCNLADCRPVLKKGWCLIAGLCVAAGSPSPSDSNKVCYPAGSTSRWSPAPKSVITLAGTTQGFRDGPLEKSQLDNVLDVAVDGTGRVFVTEARDNSDLNHRVRVIEGDQIKTLAGAGTAGNKVGPAPAAQFDTPSGVSTGPAGTLVVVADRDNGKVRLIEGGLVSEPPFASAAPIFEMPADVALVPGKLLVADRHRIWALSWPALAQIWTAGSSLPGSNDDTVTLSSAFFHIPTGVAADAQGNNVYVADQFNHCIRKISGGQVSTLAGKCKNSGYLEGSGTSALFNRPESVAVGADGDVYVADGHNHVIRRIDHVTGNTTLVAGAVPPAPPGLADGTLAEASFNLPDGIAVGPGGVVYVADYWNCRVRALRP